MNQSMTSNYQPAPGKSPDKYGDGKVSDDLYSPTWREGVRRHTVGTPAGTPWRTTLCSCS